MGPLDAFDQLNHDQQLPLCIYRERREPGRDPAARGLQMLAGSESPHGLRQSAGCSNRLGDRRAGGQGHRNHADVFPPHTHGRCEGNCFAGRQIQQLCLRGSIHEFEPHRVSRAKPRPQDGRVGARILHDTHRRTVASSAFDPKDGGHEPRATIAIDVDHHLACHGRADYKQILLRDETRPRHSDRAMKPDIRAVTSDLV